MVAKVKTHSLFHRQIYETRSCSTSGLDRHETLPVHQFKKKEEKSSVSQLTLGQQRDTQVTRSSQGMVKTWPVNNSIKLVGFLHYQSIVECRTLRSVFKEESASVLKAFYSKEDYIILVFFFIIIVITIMIIINVIIMIMIIINVVVVVIVIIIIAIIIITIIIIIVRFESGTIYNKVPRMISALLESILKAAKILYSILF